MAKTKAQRLSEVHEIALKEFDVSATAMCDEREMSLEDRRFYSIAGAQWEGVLGEQFNNRIQMESNKIHLSIIRIINDYRNNRIAPAFVSRTGDEGDELADLCAGLYRADEQDSQAEEAMDNAFEEAVGGGIGAWRLVTDYLDPYDDDSDYQRIRFEPILDADCTVFFDANAKRQDKSDAQHAFVLTGMTKEAYEREYDDDPSSWAKPVENASFDWTTADLVYVAEYYRIEETREDVHRYRTISGETETYTDDELTEEKRRELGVVGTIPVSTKSVKRRKVRKYIMSGGKVLKDAGYIAGTDIPVIPVYGKRWYVDGQERFMGHVRLSKDMQRLKNMQISRLAEEAASGGEVTPIFHPEQVAGHENTWASKAIDRPAYLLLNKMQDAAGQDIPAGPIGYTQSAEVSQAMAALLQLTEDDMQDILGNQQGGEEIMSNLSGKAVELIQSRLDGQTFIYVSNMAKAVRRCAQVWMGMARDVYGPDKGRMMKAIGEDDTPDFVEIGREVLDAKSGAPVVEADISKARFDVTVDIGPTSTTKRQAVIQNMTSMLQYVTDPADQKVVTATIMRSLEGEGMASMRDYFRKQLVSMGVEEPTEEEQAEMAEAQQPEQPDPNAIYLQSEAQKNEAQAAKAMADIDLQKAKTLETLAGIDQAERAQAMSAMELVNAALGSGTAAP